MTDQEIIRTFSPAEQKRWDAWLQAEIKQLVLDPESALNQVITLHCEALMQQIERDLPVILEAKLQTFRAELTEQQDQREKTWLQKLLTW